MFAYICRQYDFDAANIQKKIDKCKKKSSPDFVIRRKWQTFKLFSFKKISLK